MDVDESKDNDGEEVDLLDFKVDNMLNPRSPWFHIIFDDDEEEEKLLNVKMIDKPPKVGRGNARSGSRRPYILYHPSSIYERVI